MKKPVIATLSAQERKNLIETIKETTADSKYKPIAIEALTFCNDLLEELKSSKISTARLKQLLGFKTEQLKKLLQTG